MDNVPGIEKRALVVSTRPGTRRPGQHPNGRRSRTWWYKRRNMPETQQDLRKLLKSWTPTCDKSLPARQCMAELGSCSWPWVNMDPPRQGASFKAGRDNRGAFAIGRDSMARSIEAAIYIENFSASKDAVPQFGPIFYDIPNLPDRYKPRGDDVANALAEVLGSNTAVGITSTPRAVGLQGMGGIGKTVLATALLHDSNPDLRAAFPDGIVWLSFGCHMPILTKAAEFAFALTGMATSFSSVSEARAQLGLFTANKRLLIVLDDVWEPGAVDPFVGLGPGCKVLITTRDIRVLERARADTYRLIFSILALPERFLLRLQTCRSKHYPGKQTKSSASVAGCLSRLRAVGALIREGTYLWTDALAALTEASLEEIDTSWLPDPEHRNLAIVLKISVDALTDELRTCLLDCAALREDTDVPGRSDRSDCGRIVCQPNGARS